MEILLYILCGLVVGILTCAAFYQRRLSSLNVDNMRLQNDVTACNGQVEAANSRAEEMKNGYEKQLAELRTAHVAQMDDIDRRHGRQITELKEMHAAQINDISLRHDREMAEHKQLAEKQLTERLDLVQERLKTTTEQLLKQRAEELNVTNRTQMDSIIAPLKAVMAEMKKSMDDNRESFTRSTASLGEQLRMMYETTTTLGAEAEKLSKALQAGPKMQGDFGEMKLNDLLDKFGFTKGIEYDVQYTMRDAKGNVIRNDDTNDMMRPDVVLHYPDHKDVVIDSKASLTAFVNYMNASCDEERKQWLDEHVRSVRRHVDELAAKSYCNYSMEGGTTLDFVVMFVPHEAAMRLAVYGDASLWNYAFDRKVLITGEQNLFALLRMFQIAWTQQRQTENQEHVFGLANKLVDRVGLFAERFEKIGKDLTTAAASFDKANLVLKGNQSLYVPAKELIKMGAKENPKHPVPEIED